MKTFGPMGKISNGMYNFLEGTSKVISKNPELKEAKLPTQGKMRFVRSEGKNQLGHLSRDGSHLNVSLDGNNS